MDFKQKFLAALQRGDDHDALLELVHRHQAEGLAPQETYRVLEELWLALGFDKGEEDSALQANLEYVMEKVWYECPARG